MNTRYFIMLMLGCFSLNAAAADSKAVSELLQTYSQQGATQPDAKAGQVLWLKTFATADEASQRRCGSCHGDDLKQPGKHVATNKLIEPMAPSANPLRLTEAGKIEKWFKRNCIWTLGRECTASEKADLLAYIKQL